MQVGGDGGDGGGGGGGGGGEVIRKGPWMAEEDEVLMDYVRKYGPRDWSSIRSKGLLPRTGKSCRLRWVNKLKPDLKTGCKFSPEEERIVIDLQARLGNKWARIATYLPGRTDNDVKNFWSTRQKRLARILRTPLMPSTKSRNDAAAGKLEEAPSLKESPVDNELIPHTSCKKSSQGQCSSSSINGNTDGHILGHQDTNLPLLETAPLPIINQLQSPLLDISQLPSGPEFVQGFGDMNLQYEFAGQEHSSQCMDFSEDLEFFGLEVGQQGIKNEVPDAGEAPDGFFDDLPIEMFDYLDHPPTSSSSTW